MAIDFDSAAEKVFPIASNPTTQSWSHTVTEQGRGKILFVVVSNPAGAVDSVTYAGDTMTEYQDGHADDSRLYILFDPPTGSNNVTVTRASGLNDGCAGSVSYTGVDTESTAKAFGSVTEETDGDGTYSVNITSQDGQVVISAISYQSGSSAGGGTTPAVTESDQNERIATLGGDGSRFSGVGLSDSPGATTTTVGWTYDSDGGIVAWSFPMKPATPPRERTVWGATNTYVSRMVGRPVIIDAQGREVPLEQIPVDVYLRFDGAFFPTTERYSSFDEDPALGPVESNNVSNVNDPNVRARIAVRKESQFDFIMRRLTGGI